MDEEFFQGYRKTLLKSDEILLNILIPFTKQNEYFEGYKQAHRRQDDMAIVNAGMRVLLEDKGDVIKELSLSYGGMDAHTVMVTNTAGNLVGKKWDGDLIPEACDLLAKELSLPPGVPEGMDSYRNTLSLSFFFKFYLTVQTKRDSKQQSEMVPPTYQSATSVFERQPGCGSQVYEEVEDKQQQIDPVGRALPHLAATQQTTGEAMYIDDIRPYAGELSLAFVISSKAHARLISVDASDALQMPGVVDFISHKDVPGENCFGFGPQDQQVFAVDKVMYQGQIIGAIVAETRTEAIRATKAVVVKYEELTPILTIQQAIDADSFLRSDPMTIRNGDVAEGFKTSEVIIEGEAYVGGQEHFYLEMQSGIAVPSGEDDEITMLMATQFPNWIQQAVAATLGVPRNRIVCKSKRVGGGFGGKVSNSALVAMPLAVAANKLQRPVRCYLDRDDDTVITGSRHPFLGRYKVPRQTPYSGKGRLEQPMFRASFLAPSSDYGGEQRTPNLCSMSVENDHMARAASAQVGLTKSGMIQALELDLYSNCGYASDMSVTVMERAMFNADSSYRIPNVIVRGHMCRTNLPANTVMRGAGSPQGLFITEHLMEKSAQALGVSSDKFRLMNMYTEGDLTHYNQPLTNCNLSRCWEDVMRQSNYEQRQNDINVFNRHSGALLHVYTDGSVLLAHGGVEIGQGLNTKMIQIASRVLKIPMSKIHVSEYSSDKVPNAPPTAGSMSSDLNGMAVLHACEVIMERLQPYIVKDPSGSWEDWVNAAYMDRVSLSTTGFYKTPMSDYDWQTNSGERFNYFSYGVAVSEVQIDTLTGDHVVLRTDIVMDVGQSLNPAIDIGQIEGAFILGYGLFVLEEVRRSPTGVVYTDGMSTYKIPSFTDIPVQLNVSLLKGASNPRAVYSSKAIGEPPLFLAASVFFAIRHAIAAARADVGLNDSFQLNSPATAEKIRMACVDQFTKQFPEAEKGTYAPWVVDP
ncbi:Xanthine dehydrogenase/oxidase [Lamellibrachia satsuma]|nr:Xanthine dehydrogenase/oxidase [Lamellibrachia satsuma]